MKFLDYLFHGKELKAIGNYFKMLNGYSPTFTSFSGGVYEMDLTRTAINNFATHCSKLKPEIEGSALKSLEKTLQHKPNYFMDTTKFIKRLATYVAVEHTAFIIPIEDEYGRLCGWYPLRAERCEVVESEGQLYLRYLFANGSYGAIEFERVGIMTDFEYKDDLFGEDNSTLAPTMQLIHTQNEGIINAVKNSANIRFLAKVANILKPEDIKKERKRFTEDNLSADNDSGMIIYDNKFSELKQVESKPYTPNALQMQHIQENVCTHFGTNMDMAYENGAVWCMSKKTFMEYVGMTDKNGQPIAKVNYGTSGKPERTLLGRTVVLCDYVASYSAALAKDTIFAFLFNFKDYVLNTNYSMGVKKYEDNDTDDQITKGIMLVDGKVVDKNSLVVVKKIEAV